MIKEPSDKSYVVAVCLSGIFGLAGIHHFYLGRFIHGAFDFGLLAATIYFWLTGQIAWAIPFFAVDVLHTLIVTIMLVTGSYKDGSGKVVCYPGQKLT